MFNSFITGEAGQIYWPIAIVIIVWSYFWKGKALWAAAKNDQKYWFIAILFINTIGILDIIYLKFFQSKGGVKELKVVTTVKRFVNSKKK